MVAILDVWQNLCSNSATRQPPRASGDHWVQRGPGDEFIGEVLVDTGLGKGGLYWGF
jgi:hypothetical protein